MYIPNKRQKPAPAIIYCSGHTDLAFRSETYQHVILNLVEKGFIVFGPDPIGQGERLQYVNSETGKYCIHRRFWCSPIYPKKQGNHVRFFPKTVE